MSSYSFIIAYGSDNIQPTTRKKPYVEYNVIMFSTVVKIPLNVLI